MRPAPAPPINPLCIGVSMRRASLRSNQGESWDIDMPPTSMCSEPMPPPLANFTLTGWSISRAADLVQKGVPWLGDIGFKPPPAPPPPPAPGIFICGSILTAWGAPMPPPKASCGCLSAFDWAIATI